MFQNNTSYDVADIMRDPADIISTHLDQQLEFDRIEMEGNSSSAAYHGMHKQSTTNQTASEFKSNGHMK